MTDDSTDEAATIAPSAPVSRHGSPAGVADVIPPIIGHTEDSGGPDPRGSDRRTCPHNWQPVSMRFETQLLDPEGRVVVRQPDLDEGRVYLVCLKCASWTYMATRWTSYRLFGSEDEVTPGVWREDGS